MPFIRKFDTILNTSNREILKVTSQDGLILNKFDSNLNLIYSKKLYDHPYSFVNLWFDLDKNNNLYGLVNISSSTLQYLYISDKTIVKNNILRYDSKLFNIKFPYIKVIKNSKNIFYYLIDNRNIYSCKLIHHYQTDSQWEKFNIDSIDYGILSNFIVIYNNNTPTIFYFKLMNGVEEIFMATFDLDSRSWSSPCQITNSHKSKLYLSVIKINDYYHIVYSENHNSRYYCSYISIYENAKGFIIMKDQLIIPTVACSFPTIIYYNSKLYVQWIEYNNLNTCVSYDLGRSWSESVMDKASILNSFVSYKLCSNFCKDNSNIISNFFGLENSISPLGL